MIRRSIALLSSAALVAALLVTGAQASADPATPGAQDAARSAPKGKRPNIVVVMADDMRADEIKWMPRLRKLMGSSGVRFDNSFSPYPLCCPARASMLTGQYAHNHKVWWHEAPEGYAAFDDSRTIATSLKGSGYRTGFIGKYLNRYGAARSRVSGRPSYRYVPRGWDDWRAAIDNPGKGKGVHGGTYNYRDTPFNVNGRVDNRYKGKYQTDVIGDFSVDMAKKMSKRSQPFFMFVNYVAPHHGGPFEPGDVKAVKDRRGNRHVFLSPARPRSVRGKFNGQINRGAGVPKGGGKLERNISDKPRFFRKLAEPTPREKKLLRNLTRQRAEAIWVMDRNIARLVRRLKASGEWDNTVLMFTSDNGYFLGEHRQRTGKIRAHEPSLRVPFLVTGPGMRDGATRYDPISTIDVSASILDLAGAQPPRPADGRSLVPTMLGGDQGWSVGVVTESTNQAGLSRRPQGFDKRRTAIGLRTARFSYIRNRTGQHELYDVVVDPVQERNVYNSPKYASARKVLRREWGRMKDCRASGCRSTLPAVLQADPASNRQMGRSYWTKWSRRYGF